MIPMLAGIISVYVVVKLVEVIVTSNRLEPYGVGNGLLQTGAILGIVAVIVCMLNIASLSHDVSSSTNNISSYTTP